MQREFLPTIHDSERADMLANLRQRALQLQGFVRQDDPWSSALVMDRDKTLPYDSVAAIRSKQAHHLAQLESTYLQSRRNQIQAELSALTGEHVHLSKAVGSKDSNVRRLLSLRNELDAQYELELQRQAKEEEAFWVHRTSSAEEELSEVKKENEAVRLRLESMRARIAELRSATETQECEWWNVQEAISGDESKTADLRQREDVLQESISQASKGPTQTSKPVSPSLDSKNGEVSATDVKSGFDSHATAELFLEREDDVVDYPGAVAEFGATPLMGPVKGGTVVVVSGLLALHAFRTGEVSAIVSNSTRKVPVGATVVRKIRPQDASAPVQREKRQGGAVELRMPMWNSAGSVEITVLVQGQPLKHPAISFSYFSEPTISSITPSAGPSYQCTKVIIKGDNFYQSVASCAAGGEQVDYRVRLMRPSDVKVKGSGDKTRKPEDADGSNRDTFEYIGELNISDKTIACSIGPIPASGVFDVSLSLNGGRDYTAPSPSCRFAVYKPPVLSDVTPKNGVVGESASILVTGGPFLDTGAAVMQFTSTDAHSGRLLKSEVVRATVSSNGLCAKSPIFSNPAIVEISVSLDDGVRFFSAWGGAKLMIHNPPVISRFNPMCGPNTGNTEIILSGSSIVDTGDYCVKFVCGTQERIVRALVGDQEVRVKSPGFKVGAGLNEVKLAVSPNGKTWIPVAAPFLLNPNIKLLDVSPRTVGANGGVTVSVYADGLFNHPNWTFRLVARKTKGISVTGRAVWDQMRNTLEFVMPKTTLRGSVGVEVSYNDQQYFDALPAFVIVVPGDGSGGGGIGAGSDKSGLVTAEWGDAIKGRAEARVSALGINGTDGKDRAAQLKSEAELRAQAQAQERAQRMEERRKRAEALMESSKLPPRMAAYAEAARDKPSVVAQAPEGSFHPTVNTNVPDYKSHHAAFAKRIAAKKLELLRRSEHRPPRPFLLQTDLAHAPMLQRLRCKYELLPLAVAGKEKASEFGIEGAQSQWHLLDAVLSRGGTLNKADLASWGILAPSVVSGLSFDELRPRSRPRARRSRRISHSSGGGGGWRDLQLGGEGAAAVAQNSDGVGGPDGVVPDATSSDGFVGDVKAEDSRIYLTSQITQQGDRYEGDTLADGTPHGVGILRLASGDVYEGRFANGVMHGSGTWTYENGDMFKGTFSNGSAVGKAEFKASDGSIYEGDYGDNGPHGYGIKTWIDGRRYEGQWSNGCQHGKGRFSEANGNHYEGEFFAGKAEGEGVLKTAKGDVYAGQWQQGREWGEGVCQWADLRKYTGDWQGGKKHGQGCMMWPDGTDYDGSWVRGRRQGWGIFRWGDGSKYEGEWSKGKTHGMGVYILARGKGSYEGEWRNGKAHGVGKFTGPTGEEVEGIWDNGTLKPPSSSSPLDADVAALDAEDSFVDSFEDDGENASGNGSGDDGLDESSLQHETNPQLVAQGAPFQAPPASAEPLYDVTSSQFVVHVQQHPSIVATSKQIQGPVRPIKVNRADVPSFIGLKLRLKFDGTFSVAEILPNSPAAVAEIKVGDTLIAVGGKGTIGRSLREVQNMLRGPPGSALTLSIASGARDPVDITLIRAKVPPLVRSGAAGALAQQGTRAIARDMLSHVSAPHDHIVLPFDDTWIQEIKAGSRSRGQFGGKAQGGVVDRPLSPVMDDDTFVGFLNEAARKIL